MLSVYSAGHVATDQTDLHEELARIRADWLQFISTGNTSLVRSLRPEVLSSWKRSYEWGLDPSHLRALILSPSELADRLAANRLLIDVASPLLEAFVSSIKGSDFRVDLIDRDLFILMQFGEAKCYCRPRLAAGPVWRSAVPNRRPAPMPYALQPC